MISAVIRAKIQPWTTQAVPQDRPLFKASLRKSVYMYAARTMPNAPIESAKERSAKPAKVKASANMQQRLTKTRIGFLYSLLTISRTAVIFGPAKSVTPKIYPKKLLHDANGVAWKNI